MSKSIDFRKFVACLCNARLPFLGRLMNLDCFAKRSLKWKVSERLRLFDFHFAKNSDFALKKDFALKRFRVENFRLRILVNRTKFLSAKSFLLAKKLGKKKVRNRGELLEKKVCQNFSGKNFVKSFKQKLFKVFSKSSFKSLPNSL